MVAKPQGSPIVAVMQPYLFPYIGYFQLIHAVDIFVFFDDVQYIRRGWINRNRIMVNGQPQWFSFPVKKVPQQTKILDVQLSFDIRWKEKFLKTIKLQYCKAPYFQQIYPLIQQIVEFPDNRLVDFIIHQFEVIFQYLGIFYQWKRSSELLYNREADAQGKILSICKLLNAKTYINPIGGQKLYNKKVFKSAGIQLFFLESQLTPYSQNAKTFYPGLSIIDVLMWNSVENIHKMLKDYVLI